MPAVPYLTAIDYFFILCYSFLLASLLQFTAVHRYLEVIKELIDFMLYRKMMFIFKYRHSISTRTTNEDLFESSRQRRISIQARSSNLLLETPNRTRKIRSEKLDRRSTFAVVTQGLHFLRRKAPLHKLDRLARISFPLLFILCNCIYWFTFVVYTYN